MSSADAIAGGREPASLRHLEAVAVLAQSGSLSAAAASLAMTQSGLSQALARLERAVGRPLFERTPRGTRPTVAGRLLAAHAERALALLDAALAGVASRPTAARTLFFTQLHALEAVEAAGGFRQAARAVGRSQPALHRALEQLERRIGAPLLDRSPAGAVPTPLGAALAAAARRARQELAAGVALAARAQEPTRRLRVGAAPLVRAGLLPAALAELCGADPTIGVELVEGAHRDLLDALLSGRLHLILGPLRAVAPEGTVQHPLFDDELVVAARSDHPLAGGVERAERLLDHPWAASPIGTPRRLRWEALLEAAGVAPPEPRVTCSSASVVRGLLLSGGWLAMLSPDQFRSERESGQLVVVPGLAPAAARAIGSTTRDGSALDDGAARLVSVLRTLAGRDDRP